MIRGVWTQGVGGAHLLCVYTCIPARRRRIRHPGPCPDGVRHQGQERGRGAARGTGASGWALRAPMNGANPGPPPPQQASGDCARPPPATLTSSGKGLTTPRLCQPFRQSWAALTVLRRQPRRKRRHRTNKGRGADIACSCLACAATLRAAGSGVTSGQASDIGREQVLKFGQPCVTGAAVKRHPRADRRMADRHHQFCRDVQARPDIRADQGRQAVRQG